MKITAKAMEKKLNSTFSARGCFELVGFDFMVDALFHAWLIRANVNPCLNLDN